MSKNIKIFCFLKFGKNSRKLFTEYSSRTTVHGVQYIAEEKLSLTERIWWILVLISSIVLCSFFIYNILAKWSRSPVIVTFASKTTAITEVCNKHHSFIYMGSFGFQLATFSLYFLFIEIPFPAVTVCSETNIEKQILNVPRITELIKSGNLSRMGLNDTQLSFVKEILTILCPANSLLWDSLNSTILDYISTDILILLHGLAPPIECLSQFICYFSY